MAGRDAQIDFLKEKLAEEKASFKKKVNDNRWWAVRLKMTAVIVGSATTILLGLKQYFGSEPRCFYLDSEQCLSIGALILSAIVPVILAFEAFYEPRRMWIAYNQTLMSLYSISDDLEYEIRGGEISNGALKSLYDRLEAALQGADKNWSDLHMKAVDKDEPKPAEK